MSLARAFTSRRAKAHEDAAPAPLRAMSYRQTPARPSLLRNQISAPVQLLSSTNMLSYNAPDIYASSSPSTSDDDGEATSQVFSSRASNTSSTDSIPMSPAPNHLTAFFASPASPGSPSSMPASSVKSPIADPPALPSRADSHTKATHKALARKRSLSREAPPTTIFQPLQARTSAAMFSSHAEAEVHPFSRELQQVNELAEEMGLSSSIEDEEQKLLHQKGLHRFAAQDYVMEIQDLIGGVFEGQLPSLDASWI